MAEDDIEEGDTEETIQEDSNELSDALVEALESMSSEVDGEQEGPQIEYEFWVSDYDIITIGETIGDEEDLEESDNVDREDLDLDEDFFTNDDVLHVPPDFNKYLDDDEVVSGKMHHIDIELRNGSDHLFPGGLFTNIEVSPGVGTSVGYSGIEREVPEIAPGESHTVSIHIRIQHEGDVSIKGGLTSSDDGEVVSTMYSDNVLGFSVRAIPKERLLLLDMVDDIREELT